MPRFHLPLAMLAAALLFSLPAAADVDPLCANMHGFERFNPLAPNPLIVITKCIPTYCDPKSPDPTQQANLKKIDDSLSQLTIISSQTNVSLQKFIRACKAINGDMTQVGPKMQIFRDAVMDLSLTKGKLSDQYYGMQQAPLEPLIEDTGTKVAQPPFSQPVCMQQMNKAVIDELNAAQAILNKSDIDCSPSTK